MLVLVCLCCLPTSGSNIEALEICTFLLSLLSTLCIYSATKSRALALILYCWGPLSLVAIEMLNWAFPVSSVAVDAGHWSRVVRYSLFSANLFATRAAVVHVLATTWRSSPPCTALLTNASLPHLKSSEWVVLSSLVLVAIAVQLVYSANKCTISFCIIDDGKGSFLSGIYEQMLELAGLAKRSATEQQRQLLSMDTRDRTAIWWQFSMHYFMLMAMSLISVVALGKAKIQKGLRAPRAASRATIANMQANHASHAFHAGIAAKQTISSDAFAAMLGMGVFSAERQTSQTPPSPSSVTSHTSSTDLSYAGMAITQTISSDSFAAMLGMDQFSAERQTSQIPPSPRSVTSHSSSTDLSYVGVAEAGQVLSIDTPFKSSIESWMSPPDALLASLPCSSQAPPSAHFANADVGSNKDSKRVSFASPY